MDNILSNWTHLPQGLLRLIFQHFFQDFSSFDLNNLQHCQSVCSSWRSVAKEICRIITATLSGTPLLLLPHKNKPYDTLFYNTCLVNVHDHHDDDRSNVNTISSFKLPFDDDFNDCMMVYSSYRGWLLLAYRYAIDSSSLSARYHHKSSVFLYNPISKSCHQLPPLPQQLRLDCRIKFVTSRDPDPEIDHECYVCVLWERSCCDDSRVLATCQLRYYPSKSWNILSKPSHELSDMIFYDGHLCIVTDDGKLYVYDDVIVRPKFDIVCPTIYGSVVAENMENNVGKCIGLGDHQFYLVESKNGKLFMVERVLIKSRTNSFRVFELNRREKKWEEVGSFGYDDDDDDQEQQEALCLAWNEAMFVPIIDDDAVLKPNCIYTMDEYWDNGSLICRLEAYDMRNHTTDESFSSPDKLQFTTHNTRYSLLFRPDMSTVQM